LSLFAHPAGGRPFDQDEERRFHGFAASLGVLLESALRLDGKLG
jgi:hypothetical protein